MKVIIDCGACKGEAIEPLKNTYKGFEYIAFEPLPRFHNKLEKFDIKLRKEAVWVKDEIIEFYPAENDESSTLYKNKITGNVGSEPIQVRAIDFSNFLRKFSKDDYIVVKMDIEGAEYEVLDKLLRENTIEYIDELFCEFHHHKIPSISKKKHRSVIRKIRKSPIELYIQNGLTFNGKVIYYTAIFGWYDNLKDPRKVDKSAKYICICDEYTKEKLQDKCDVWEFKIVKPQFNSPRKENRYWKINSHIALKDYYYNYSVYIDGRFQLYRTFSHKIKDWLGKNDFALEKHPGRECAYSMAFFYKRTKAGIPEKIEEQVQKYKQKDFPENIGLAGNYFIIRRNTEDVKKVNKIWWKQIDTYSVRDQISFTYSIWKAGLDWSRIPIKNQFIIEELDEEDMIIKKGEHRVNFEEGKITKDLVVIGVGLPKTGTKTLVSALNELGIRSAHYLYPPEIQKGRNIYHMIDNRNIRGTAENSGIICYKDLYYRYPNSKFILTKRNLQSWLKSCRIQLVEKNPVGSKIVKPRNIKVRKRTYGWHTFNRKKLVNQYKKHHKEVRKFFKDKQERYMEMNIIQGDGWKKLCKFLDKPIPKKSFPHKNKSKND